MVQSKQSKNFTEGKILLPLINFALPVLLAIFLQTMYGAVDMLIVGKFSNAAEVSAVSTGSWILNTITCVITGLSMGTTILLGRKIGERKECEGGEVLGSSIFLFGVMALFITVIFIFLSSIIAKAMHVPYEAFTSTVKYIQICSAGIIFIVGYNIIGSIFRGIGNSKMPLISVSIACVFNIFLDIILVKNFNMGASGATIATVISQGISVFISLAIIKKQKLPFNFSFKNIIYKKNNNH